MSNRKSKPRVTAIDLQIAARLRPARDHAGLTQMQAAKPLGIKYQQLQKYENGTDRISCGKLFIFARVCRKPVSWFFKGLIA